MRQAVQSLIPEGTRRLSRSWTCNGLIDERTNICRPKLAIMLINNVHKIKTTRPLKNGIVIEDTSITKSLLFKPNLDFTNPCLPTIWDQIVVVARTYHDFCNNTNDMASSLRLILLLGTPWLSSWTRNHVHVGSIPRLKIKKKIKEIFDV